MLMSYFIFPTEDIEHENANNFFFIILSNSAKYPQLTHDNESSA